MYSFKSSDVKCSTQHSNQIYTFFHYYIFQFVSNPADMRVAQIENKAEHIKNTKIEHNDPTPVEHDA